MDYCYQRCELQIANSHCRRAAVERKNYSCNINIKSDFDFATINYLCVAAANMVQCKRRRNFRIHSAIFLQEIILLKSLLQTKNRFARLWLNKRKEI